MTLKLIWVLLACRTLTLVPSSSLLVKQITFLGTILSSPLAVILSLAWLWFFYLSGTRSHYGLLVVLNSKNSASYSQSYSVFPTLNCLHMKRYGHVRYHMCQKVPIVIIIILAAFTVQYAHYHKP